VGIAFTTISLTYGTELLFSFVDHLDTHSDHPTDALAFSVIVFLVVRSNITKVPLPSIFRIIARDATSYFLIIFTSHLVIVMFYWLASVSTPSQPPLFSLWLAYTLIGRNQATSFFVSDVGTRSVRTFTESFPKKQRKHSVRLNISFPPNSSSLIDALGISQ